MGNRDTVVTKPCLHPSLPFFFPFLSCSRYTYYLIYIHSTFFYTPPPQKKDCFQISDGSDSGKTWSRRYMSSLHPSLMVAVGGSGPWNEPGKTCGRMFLIQSLAASLPPEVVPQLLCVVELRMARAPAGAVKPYSISGLPSLPPPPPLKIRGWRNKESDLSSRNEVQI